MRKKRLIIAIVAVAALIFLFAGCRITINTEPDHDLTYTLMEDGTYSVSAGPAFNSVWITIPASYSGRAVTAISADGFVACPSLVTVVIPEGIISIGSHAFDNCQSITTVTLPSTLKKVGDYAFSGCVKLTKIEFPKGVESIGYGALASCRSLETLTVPFVGDKADISENSYLGYLFESKNYESQVKYVPKSLKNVTLTGMSSVPSYSFYNCKYIETIDLQNKPDTIGWYAFYNCRSITGITVPEGTVTIGISAFENCLALTGITLPSSLARLEAGVFSDCISIEVITYGGTWDDWKNITKPDGLFSDVREVNIKCTNKAVSVRTES